jgi:hypothetical protein
VTSFVQLAGGARPRGWGAPAAVMATVIGIAPYVIGAITTPAHAT